MLHYTRRGFAFVLFCGTAYIFVVLGLLPVPANEEGPIAKSICGSAYFLCSQFCLHFLESPKVAGLDGLASPNCGWYGFS
jgi:hypothetical protein